jgi:hypothetical protein
MDGYPLRRYYLGWRAKRARWLAGTIARMPRHKVGACHPGAPAAAWLAWT